MACIRNVFCRVRPVQNILMFTILETLDLLLFSVLVYFVVFQLKYILNWTIPRFIFIEIIIALLQINVELIIIHLVWTVVLPLCSSFQRCYEIILRRWALSKKVFFPLTTIPIPNHFANRHLMINSFGTSIGMKEWKRLWQCLLVINSLRPQHQLMAGHSRMVRSSFHIT